ncbi:MAG: riboflavin synthase [Flavobacteriales bacterium]|nr:riboflavin synthase [Flavobacteriales bacterium]MBP6641675.1 riboflavin synthase [Flavobacteriales bacterium]MBP7154369.1 riboflavin synthase [Flavobacteriales bacterium]HQV75333.1 riboflavin synthase [Flavobacteriales bacterium]HQW39694.1 riboflavin synthase [Flavobacteriales bacterium]
MFTGIVEEVGGVVSVTKSGTNLDLVIAARFAPELRVDQSVSHNGVCLTVVKVQPDQYMVSAVQETLERSNIGALNVGDPVNLERCLRLGDRLDGHMVQGHVDTVVPCIAVKDLDGSRWFTFKLPEQGEMLVEKGSICINGVSLTIADLAQDSFSVAVIPYTFEHTNFRTLVPGGIVNIEYDVIGKYVQRMLAR